MKRSITPSSPRSYEVRRRTTIDKLARVFAILRELDEVTTADETAARRRLFVTFFEAVTPVDEISPLRLGSRPARRSSARGIEDLRAIPWIFSWTQARIVLPAWLGLGTALAWTRERHGVELLREMASDWPFFATLLSNAEMGCAKADLAIARRYAELWPDPRCQEIFTPLAAELELNITGCRRFATRIGYWTATRCCWPRSTVATRSWTRSRSCRSSCCGACANNLRSCPRNWDA